MATNISETALVKGRKAPKWWKSKRYFIATLAAIGYGSVFFQRVNLSMALICMVDHTIEKGKLRGNVDSLECLTRIQHEREGGESDWSKVLQGLLLGAIFIGYFTTVITGVEIAAITSHKASAMLPLFGLSLLTLISPIAGGANIWIFLYVRIVMGLMCSVCMPALFVSVDTWSTKAERPFFLGVLFTGGIVAIAFTFPLSAFLCHKGFYNNWNMVFYATGGIGFLWCLLWYVYMYDTPEEDPTLSDIERDYLLRNQYRAPRQKYDVPWWELWKSKTVLAMISAHVAFAWQFFMWMSVMPMYMREVLRYDIETNGFRCMRPFLGLAVVFNIWSLICQQLRAKFQMTMLNIRRLSIVVGFGVASLCYVSLSAVDCTHDSLAISLLTVALSFSGCAILAFGVNPYDICRVYAVAISSLAYSVSLAFGIVSPVVATILTLDRTPEQWRRVILLCVAFMLVGGAIFLIFISDKPLDLPECQVAGSDEEEEEEDKEEEEGEEEKEEGEGGGGGGGDGEDVEEQRKPPPAYIDMPPWDDHIL